MQLGVVSVCVVSVTLYCMLCMQLKNNLLKVVPFNIVVFPLDCESIQRFWTGEGRRGESGGGKKGVEGRQEKGGGEAREGEGRQERGRGGKRGEEGRQERGGGEAREGEGRQERRGGEAREGGGELWLENYFILYTKIKLDLVYYYGFIDEIIT